MRKLHADFELAVDSLQATGRMGASQAAEARRWGDKASRGGQPLVDLRRGLGYAREMR